MADANASPAAPASSALPDNTAPTPQQSSNPPPSTATSDSTLHNATQPGTTALSQSQPPASTTQGSAAEDTDLDASIKHELASPPASTTEGTSASHTQPQPTADMAAPSQQAVLPPAPTIPQKKDTSLREFLGKMDDYTPLIPDAVTDYYLTLAGLPPPSSSAEGGGTDRRLARLLALATQKFIADIAADAYQYSRIRSTNTTSNNPLTGLGGAASSSLQHADNEAGGSKGKKDPGKSAPLGGPRAGFGGGGAGGAGQGRTVLTMEDLGMAVGEFGVNVKRGEFYR